MKRFDVRLIWGALLVVIGMLLLFQNIGFLENMAAAVWVLLFGAAGGAFVWLFLTNRDRWWAIVPGFALLGISGLIGLDLVWPSAADIIGGPLFLGGVGLGFWVIYFFKREQWWAIIPGGVLFTLALVALLSNVLGGTATGSLFFLGLGGTFALLAVVPTSQGRLYWAFIPAAVLLSMGVLVIVAATPLIGYLWPVSIILLGMVLLLRAFGIRLGRGARGG
ncbi:MAG: hypothetical protein ACOYZ7_07455 [Chloroflexota bacterium]